MVASPSTNDRCATTMPHHNDNPVIWLICDDKPGHVSQLRGLGARLEARTGAQLHWIKAAKYPLSLLQLLRGRPPVPELPAPDLIIAAGHGTHRLLLALRRRLGVPAVVLMKPSFPLAWVDAAVIPDHDNPPANSHVLPVTGVLNAASPVETLPPQPQGMILTGGPSRHYHWDTEDVCEQILALCHEYPDWGWTLATSRRTPVGLAQKLLASGAPNLNVVTSEEAGPDWLSCTLPENRAVWVSPDSVSMVSEALTTGIPTGLLSLTPHHGSRVARGMAKLVSAGFAADWADRKAVMHAESQLLNPLWEADRAAQWLAERFLAPPLTEAAS